MSNSKIHTDGFDAFAEMLEEFAKKAEQKNVIKVLEIGAK